MNDNARQWVKALRSGDYEQGHGRLTRLWEKGNQHCCLGVACEEYLKENNGLEVDDVTTEGYRSYNGRHLYLPEPVTEWLGLASDSGRYSEGLYNGNLSFLNDGGHSFEQIADFIESEPEGLFK